MILLLDRIEIHAYTTLKSVKDSSMYQVSTPSVVQKISKDKEGACQHFSSQVNCLTPKD